VFATQEGEMLTPDRVQKLLRRLGEKVGLPNLHPHQLRHSFATAYLRNGGNVLELQRLLGHSSITMVARYAAIAEVDLQDGHREASPADRWRL
jgi:integrase/recombinase XerD